VICWLKNMN